MITSSTNALRFKAIVVALILTTSFALNCAAQTIERFYPVDKATLETYINTYSWDQSVPFLIVDNKDKVAMQSSITNNNKSLKGQAIAINENGYVDADADQASYLFLYNPSISGNDIKLNLRTTDFKFLHLSTNLFSWMYDIPNDEQLTFLFNDEGTEFKIKTKGGLSVTYEGSEPKQGFMLKQDVTDSSLSLYRADYYRYSLPEDPVDKDNQILLNVNLTNETARFKTNFCYILNKGEDITLDNLLATDHVVSEQFYKTLTAEVKFPIYDPDATTIWIIPTVKYTTGNIVIEHCPLGPVFRGVFAADDNGDISTGLVAPEAADADAAPTYYTLQGVRVSEPTAPGIYFCRRGSQVSKIAVK